MNKFIYHSFFLLTLRNVKVAHNIKNGNDDTATAMLLESYLTLHKFYESARCSHDELFQRKEPKTF